MHLWETINVNLTLRNLSKQVMSYTEAFEKFERLKEEQQTVGYDNVDNKPFYFLIQIN